MQTSRYTIPCLGVHSMGLWKRRSLTLQLVARACISTFLKSVLLYSHFLSSGDIGPMELVELSSLEMLKKHVDVALKAMV